MIKMTRLAMGASVAVLALALNAGIVTAQQPKAPESSNTVSQHIPTAAKKATATSKKKVTKKAVKKKPAKKKKVVKKKPVKKPVKKPS